MSKLILTIGIPGSGKSTWARSEEALVEYRLWGGLAVLERDEIRKELSGDERNHANEAKVTNLQRSRAREFLGRGVNVIIADTNLKPKFRREWQELANQVGAEFIVHFFDTPIEVCIERDAARDNPVGREVITRMHAQLLQNLRTYGVDN